MDYGKSFGSWFRHELTRRRLTQRQFALDSGIPKSSINEWYHGRQPPDPASCKKIALTWKLDVDYVVSLAGHTESYSKSIGDSRDEIVAMLLGIEWNEERERYVRALLDAMPKVKGR